MNILLSSAGRRVEFARSFRAVLDRLPDGGLLVGTDVDWLAPALQIVDTPLRVPPFEHPGFVESLRDICQEQAIDLLLPLNDREIGLLSAARDQFSDVGTQLAVCPPAAANICGDKWLTYHFFRRLGLPTPVTWLPDLPGNEPCQWPAFIKPRDGSAGQGAFGVRSEREYEFFRDYVRNPIVQEFIAGPEITSDVICDLQGEVLAVVSRQRIAVRGGEAIKSVTVRDERIEQACREIAAALPACGPITVQCLLKEGEPHFVEINARLGGGVPLAIAAGVDVAQLLVQSASGFPMTHLNRTAVTGIYMTRCDESFFLKATNSEILESHHFRS